MTHLPTPPEDDVLRRLRAAGATLAAAADAARPAPTPGAVAATRPEPVRRSRRVVVAAAAVVLTVAAGALAWSVRLTDQDDGDRLVTDPGPGAERCRPDGDVLALTTTSSERDKDLYDGFSSVAIVAPGSSTPTYVNEPRQVVSDPSFSPAGDQVALNWADGDYESAGPSSESIWVVDVDDGDARPVTNGPRDTEPAWSPDGRWIAYSTQSATDGGYRAVGLVPAQGGEPRVLADLGTGFAEGLTWTADGRAVLAWSGDDTGTIWRIDLDGTRTELAVVTGRILSAELVPGGTELLVEVQASVAREATRLAIDLADGIERTVVGPSGRVRWSRDGQRLYLLAREDVDDGARTVVRRARYNGTAIEAGETAAAAPENLRDVAVGPCTPAPATGPRPDRQAIGTEWRLGPRRLLVEEAAARPGCAEPACTPVHLEVFDDADDPACTTAEGELRGVDLALDPVVVDPDGCWPADAWADTPPDRLEVAGDVLRIRTPVEYNPEGWILTYGAAYVGAGPAEVEPVVPRGPATEPFAVTTTTAALPPPAPCDGVDRFATDLGASTARPDGPDGTTPEDLVARSPLVVRGQLVDSLLTSLPADGPPALVYQLVVEEALHADGPDEVAAGQVVDVVVPFTYDVDGWPPPGLGEYDLGGQVPRGSGVPVVAFLTHDGPAQATDWYVDGPNGLAVACPGGALGGMVGVGPAWTALAGVDALADLARAG